MKFILLFASIILLSYTPVQCQRRGSWRNMRHGNRRQPVNMEERGRTRNMRAPHIAPNYNTNQAVPVSTSCQKVVEPPCSKVIDAAHHILQNVPKAPDVPRVNLPIVPNMDFTQNMVLSPNLQLIQSPQILPNPQPIPNLPVPNMPTQGPNLQNLQYLQNLQLVPNMPLIQEPILNVPLEVPIQVPETIRIQIPYPHMDPPEKPCPCSSPTPFMNPFLPAASPVSAWSPPISNLLPPMTSQTRSHFLRKIPIPPPTL